MREDRYAERQLESAGNVGRFEEDVADLAGGAKRQQRREETESDRSEQRKCRSVTKRQAGDQSGEDLSASEKRKGKKKYLRSVENA